jgi:hypothetical protein
MQNRIENGIDQDMEKWVAELRVNKGYFQSWIPFLEFQKVWMIADTINPAAPNANE